MDKYSDYIPLIFEWTYNKIFLQKFLKTKFLFKNYSGMLYKTKQISFINKIRDVFIKNFIVNRTNLYLIDF